MPVHAWTVEKVCNRELLLEMERPERAAAISDLLVAELREQGLPGAERDSEFRKLDKRWENLEQLREALAGWARSGIGLGYLHSAELDGLETVEQAAAYLALELEPPPPPAGPLQESIPTEAIKESEILPYRGEHRVRGKMIFALGSARSGTTLLRSLLGAHPKLYAPPELNLLLFNDLGERRTAIHAAGRHWMAHGLPQALSWQMKLSDQEAHELVNKFASGRLSTPRAYELLLGGAGDGGWLVDKSPLYCGNPIWLGRAEEMFDEPRYIYLTRHPYSVIESLVRMRFYRLQGAPQPGEAVNPWLLAERNWLGANRNILDFLEKVPLERQLRLVFEDLVADPAAQLARVQAFLGLQQPWPPAEEAFASARVIRGLGDPNQSTRKGIDPSLAERWRNACPPQKLDSRTVDLAAQLGYELPGQ